MAHTTEAVLAAVCCWLRDIDDPSRRCKEKAAAW
jgi:hypothetical protein